MLFEHSKMQKLSTCWAKEAWRDSWKHWQSFGYVVAAQIGCDVLVLAIAILSIKTFKISYPHKYWCFLSISKCKNYLLAELKKNRETIENIGRVWVCCGFSNRWWCFGPCYCHIVNKNFQNIISPQVLMLLEHFKMQKLSIWWANKAWRDSRKHWQSFGYVVAAQMGCDVLVLAIAILLIKNFKISYLHKYWCFLSILKCKSYLLAELKKLEETLESIDRVLGMLWLLK